MGKDVLTDIPTMFRLASAPDIERVIRRVASQTATRVDRSEEYKHRPMLEGKIEVDASRPFVRGVC